MNDTDLRARRKQEHIEAVAALPDGETGSWLSDVLLIPETAPEVDWDDVDIGVDWFGRRVAFPVMINAMTGGSEESGLINRRLARAARKWGMPMAVGSETAALQDPRWTKTYTVVREENPTGVVIANVGMGTPPDRAAAAVALIAADTLQMHFNAAQEIFMREGDRCFRGALGTLEAVASALPVPVVAKEVGQGISAEAARRMVDAGASGIDVGGLGGTNFMAVEAWRRGAGLSPEWARWGIPTAAAVAEVAAQVGDRAVVVASGGVRTGHDVARAIALGADLAAMAGPLLRLARQPDGETALDRFLAQLEWDLRAVLLLSGCANWEAFRSRPRVIVGHLAEWMRARGLPLN